MPLRAVIFDRDGVLTHFDFRPVLELFKGVPISLDSLRGRWDRWTQDQSAPRTDDAERALLVGFWASVCDDLALSGELRDRLNAFDYTTTLRAFPDARSTLVAIRERGLSVGVLSNFPMASLSASLKAVGLHDLVDVASAAPVIGARKPHRAAYEHVVATLGVAPSECVMIDDEPECVAGARAVGIHTYLLARGGDRAASDPGVLYDLAGLLREIDLLATSAPHDGAATGLPPRAPAEARSRWGTPEGVPQTPPGLTVEGD